MNFKEIKTEEISENTTSLLKNNWGLVTAGSKTAYNTMTVSWGGIGELWGKDVATIYIRPQRYTREFLDANEYFTLSFYSMEDRKRIHSVCGSKSGRNTNKAELAEITPCFSENAPFFNEAKIVLVCKKIAKGEFKPDQFIDNDIMKNYEQNDFHYIYYGEIEKVLISK